MKRYYLFSGNKFSFEGGWSNFLNSFKSLEEAKSTAKELLLMSVDPTSKEEWELRAKRKWVHIVDIEEEVIICNFGLLFNKYTEFKPSVYEYYKKC